MNSDSPLPHDAEPLLKRPLKETTPDFERRWADLKRTLRAEPAPRPKFWGGASAWLKIGSLAAATALIALVLTHSSDHPRPLSAERVNNFVHLLDLEGDLRTGLPLAEPEATEILLSLPTSNRNHS